MSVLNINSAMSDTCNTTINSILLWMTVMEPLNAAGTGMNLSNAFVASSIHNFSHSVVLDSMN